MPHSANESRSSGRIAPLLRCLASASRLAAVGVVVAWIGAVRAQETLNPKTYTSPNGEFALRVEPTNPEGAGPARYEVKRKGKPVWHGEESFTLWDAAITDTGVVAGYGYQHGLNGRPSNDRLSNESYLYSVIIDERGFVRVRNREGRRPSNIRGPHPTPLVPIAPGILTEPAADRFIVRLRPDFPETHERWKVFSLSTGEALPDVIPEQPQHKKGFHIAIACLQVPGVLLVVIQWYLYDSTMIDGALSTTHSARLALLNTEGKSVWTLDCPEEYAEFGERFNSRWGLQDSGVVQCGVGPLSFWFHSYHWAGRVYFSIQQDDEAPGGWRVTEAARDRIGPPQTATERGLPIEDVVLAPLGVITLQQAVPCVQESPLHDLYDFEIGTDARFGLIRLGQTRRFLLAEETGRVVLERDISALGKGVTHLAAMPNGCWMVYSSGIQGKRPEAWTLDPSLPNPQFKPYSRLEVGAMQDVVALPDAGFVALSGPDYVYANNLTRIDTTGAVVWSAPGADPRGVAVTTDGRIAMLEGRPKQIRLFSLDGAELQVISLPEVLGQEPTYVNGLSPDRDGGLILCDFQGSPPVYQLTGEGRLLGSLRVQYSSGGAFSPRGAVQSSPLDGRLWACSGDGILRLDDTGKADMTLGDAAFGASQPLRHINALCVGDDGRIYAVNGASGAVHVFDKDGSLLRLLKPDTGDFAGRRGSGSICVQGDGTVRYASTGSPGGFVRFDPNGQRVGRDPRLMGEVREKWCAIPGTVRRWAIGYESIALIDESGAIEKRLTHRPDGASLGRVGEGAAAPDGSFAVISSEIDRRARGPSFVCVFTKVAEPVTTLPVPENASRMRMAFNGRMAALTLKNEVLLLSLKDGTMKRFALPEVEGLEQFWYLYSSPDGKEVWALRAGTTDLVRYPFE